MVPSGEPLIVPVSALRLGILLAALALPAAAQARPPVSPAGQHSPADTLRYAVRAGETLIVALPPRVGGAEARYQVDRAPALSWLVDRSFMWRTLARERGLMPVVLRRLVAGREPETVVLLVEVTA